MKAKARDNNWLEQIAPYFYNLNLPFPAEKDERTGMYVSSVELVYGAGHGEDTPGFQPPWEEMTSVYRLDPAAAW